MQIEARRASNVAFSFRLFVQSSKVLSVMAVGNLLQSFAQSSRQVEKPYSRRDFRDASLVSSLLLLVALLMTYMQIGTI